MKSIVQVLAFFGVVCSTAYSRGLNFEKLTCAKRDEYACYFRYSMEHGACDIKFPCSFSTVYCKVFSNETRNTDLTASKGSQNQIEVVWMNDMGLLCDSGSNADNIVKVFCGEKGGNAVRVTSPAYSSNPPDFEITNLTCEGTESSISNCSWGLNHIQMYPYCTTFVGAQCN